MRAKLGLFTQEDDDKALVDDLLAWMQRRSADFTNTFRSLTSGRLAGDVDDADPEFEAWHRRLEARRGRQPQSPAEAEDLMRRHNPAFIPRNHKVEEALQAATSSGRLFRDGAAARRAGDTLRPRARPADVQRARPGRAALPHVLRHVARHIRHGPDRLCPAELNQWARHVTLLPFFVAIKRSPPRRPQHRAPRASNSSLARQE